VGVLVLAPVLVLVLVLVLGFAPVLVGVGVGVLVLGVAIVGVGVGVAGPVAMADVPCGVVVVGRGTWSSPAAGAARSSRGKNQRQAPGLSPGRDPVLRLPSIMSSPAPSRAAL